MQSQGLMDPKESDKVTTPSQTLHPQYENPIPWTTQPPFPNFDVGPLLIYPYQGQSGTQLAYMNAMHTESRPDVYSPNLIQENEDIRNERRKQSNRESARRSRLRKQEECQKLQETVNLLANEICMLKRQLMKLSEDCGELYEKNKCIEEDIIATHGEDAIFDLKAIRPASVER